jgi:hypothetical protein
MIVLIFLYVLRVKVLKLMDVALYAGRVHNAVPGLI